MGYLLRHPLLRRYLIFFCGLFGTAAGISLFVKGGLGTSPFSSPALVIHLLSGISMGTATFCINTVLFFAQLALLGRAFPKIQWLQLPATFIFSAFVDLVSWMLAPLPLPNYFAQAAVLFCGCVVLGLGIALEVHADVLILPGEGIVKVLAQKFHAEFGITKIIFDLCLAVFAAALSLIGCGRIMGLREGTAIAIFTVGSFTRFFQNRLRSTAAIMSGQDNCPISKAK